MRPMPDAQDRSPPDARRRAHLRRLLLIAGLMAALAALVSLLGVLMRLPTGYLPAVGRGSPSTQIGGTWRRPTEQLEAETALLLGRS
jgi:hypothetical protein